MQRLVAAGRDIRFDPLRLDDAGVLQDDRLLLRKERTLRITTLNRDRRGCISQRCDDRRNLVDGDVLEELL